MLLRLTNADNGDPCYIESSKITIIHTVDRFMGVGSKETKKATAVGLGYDVGICVTESPDEIVRLIETKVQ